MPITIGSNIASLRTQRVLGKTSQEIGTTFERLSTGLRINHASDDAAGLAVSSVLNAQGREYAQGIRNLNDGISYYSIADSTLNEMSGLVMRLKELATQSANGTYSDKQRTAINTENQKLIAEYIRAVGTATFNGRNVLDPLNPNLTLQVGIRGNHLLNLEAGSQIRRATVKYGAGIRLEGAPFTTTYARMVADDFNNDGITDILGNRNEHIYAGIHLGGGGIWALTFDGIVNQIAAGDVDGDGYKDIVATTASGLEVAINNHDGTFTYSIVDTSQAWDSLAVGDLDGDNIADIVVGMQGMTEGSTFRGVSGGGFSQRITNGQVFAGGLSGEIVLADVTGDGNTDIIASLTDGSASIGVGSGNADITEFKTISATSSFTHIEAADLNGDGVVELVAADGDYLKIFNYQSTNEFTQIGAIQSLIGSINYFKLGDLNGDGKLDIAAAPTSGNGFATALNNGNLSFDYVESNDSVQAGSIAQIIFDDYNRDGTLDIITYAGGNANYLSTATSTYTNNIQNVSLANQQFARDALTYFDKLLSNIQLARGSIGAQQSRITAALSVTTSTRLNVLNAASRITDVDIAQESSELVRKQILLQTGSSLLAQANQQPQLALQLLRG